MSKLTSYGHKLRNSAVLYGAAGTVVRVGANLFLVPLVLTHLSTKEQALWWVFVALGNFANLADFGFGAAITRVYSFFWAGAEDFQTEGLGAPAKQSTPNFTKLRQLNATAKHLYWRLSVGCTLLLAIVGSPILIRSIQRMEHPAQVWLQWAIYLMVIAYNLGSSHWLLACQGTNQVRQLQILTLGSSLGYFFTAAMLLSMGFGMSAMIIAMATRGILARHLGRRAYLKAMPASGKEQSRVDFSMLSRLWPNAQKFGLLSIGGFLIANGGVLICNQLMDEHTTASFGLTAQVGSFLMNFAALWLTVKWPQITILRTRGQITEMAMLFARRLFLVMLTFSLLAILLLWAGNMALAWKGSKTRLFPFPYLAFYLFYLGQQLFYVQFGNLAHTENVIPFFKISVLTGLGVFTLSLLLTPSIGLWGLLLAPWIVESLYSSWFTVKRGFQGQPLKVPQFVRAAILGHL